MNKLLLSVLALFISGVLVGQSTDQNSADRLLAQNSKLTIGGYGEIHYNQGIAANTYSNGKLDVHRMVMLFGYNFTNKTKFITELEFEHVKEVYVEQAFLQHQINDYMNFRAGLMLVPMGIINEYHEPTTFNGVERPLLDKYIAPSTWREIGFGLSGNFTSASLRYQAYLMNGFNGYDDAAKFSAANGLRKGRQKGAESYGSSPNLTARVQYYGIKGLQLGLSGYFGDSQSKLYDKLDKSNDTLVADADSSVVGISMLGFDARYNLKALQLRGQFYFVSLSNTLKYNTFGGTDIGKQMMGYYVEAAYNVFHHTKLESQLLPFVRYEAYNTQHQMEAPFTADDKYNKTAITTGIGWKINNGAMLKADMQFVKSKADSDYAKTFNAGVAVMF